MQKISIIDSLDMSFDGPISKCANGDIHLVHLQQGDIDGACGPYCLLMALLINGIVLRVLVKQFNHPIFRH